MSSPHTGGCKGYKFTRAVCPRCLRIVAVSFNPDGKTVHFRKHLLAHSDVQCPQLAYDYPRGLVQIVSEQDLQRLADKVKQATGIQLTKQWDVPAGCNRGTVTREYTGNDRLIESAKLISAYLVKCHNDKDVNSLFVRFNEILQLIERLKEQIPK